MPKNHFVGVESNVDVLENLADAVGIQQGAFKSWIADGAFTGIEKDGVNVDVRSNVDVLGNMREIIGIQQGGVVGVEDGGIQMTGIEKDGVKIHTGGITIAIVAVLFGLMLVFIVVWKKNRSNEETSISLREAFNNESQKTYGVYWLRI